MFRLYFGQVYKSAYFSPVAALILHSDHDRLLVPLHFTGPNSQRAVTVSDTLTWKKQLLRE